MKVFPVLNLLKDKIKKSNIFSFLLSPAARLKINEEFKNNKDETSPEKIAEVFFL